MIFWKSPFSHNFFACWNVNTLEMKLLPQQLVEVDTVVISVTQGRGGGTQMARGVSGSSLDSQKAP